jgi:RNA polymerase sigma-70 factor (ECF subfamily)
MQDGVLVPETREGDVERLYREHGARLWRAVFAFTGDREIASDSVSEAFLQVLQRGDEVHSPLAWIWRASFRIAAGELKDRRRRGATGNPSVKEQSYEIPEPAEEVVRALMALSPNQRAAVVLHHYAGYPVKEIAAMIGSTSAAVRVHLSVGRKRLRELLGGN